MSNATRVTTPAVGGGPIHPLDPTGITRRQHPLFALIAPGSLHIEGKLAFERYCTMRDLSEPGIDQWGREARDLRRTLRLLLQAIDSVDLYPDPLHIIYDVHAAAYEERHGLAVDTLARRGTLLKCEAGTFWVYGPTEGQP